LIRCENYGSSVGPCDFIIPNLMQALETLARIPDSGVELLERGGNGREPRFRLTRTSLLQSLDAAQPGESG
jgi:hypothetical protein